MESFHGVVAFVGMLAGYTPPPDPFPDNRGFVGLSAGCRIPWVNKVGFYLYGPLTVLDDPEPGTPAAKAGFKKGDVILSFNGKKYLNPNNYLLALSRYDLGDVVTYVIERDGKQLTLKLTLAPRER